MQESVACGSYRHVKGIGDSGAGIGDKGMGKRFYSSFSAFNLAKGFCLLKTFQVLFPYDLVNMGVNVYFCVEIHIYQPNMTFYSRKSLTGQVQV